jgi:hypothetical protein
MNYVDLSEKFIKSLCSTIKTNFNGDDFIRNLYNAFTEENRKFMDAIQLRNSILIKTFCDIAQLYNIKYHEEYDIKSLSKSVTEFKNKLAVLTVSNKPKMKYLCYSLRDEDGHSYCEVLTEKNLRYVEAFLSRSYESFEYLYDDQSTLLLAMGVRKAKPLESLMDLDESDLVDEIDAFFKEIIADDTVSLSEFSEYFKCIVSTNRHSGSATSWVYL